MDIETMMQSLELIRIHRRSLDTFKQQAAMFGFNCPPATLLQIEAEEKRIHDLKVQIKNLVLQEFNDQASIPESNSIQNISVLEILQDAHVAEQMKIFVDIVRNSSKLQIYVDVFEEMIIHVNNSNSILNIAKIMIPIMENKLSEIKFDRYYYVISNWYYMIQEYNKCIEYLDSAINIYDKLEYREMRVRSLYNLSYSIYSSNMAKVAYDIRLEILLEIEDEIKLAQDMIYKSKEDVMFLRRKHPRNEQYISLEESIQDLLKNIGVRATLIEVEEMRLRTLEAEAEEEKNRQRLEEDSKNERSSGDESGFNS